MGRSRVALSVSQRIMNASLAQQRSGIFFHVWIYSSTSGLYKDIYTVEQQTYFLKNHWILFFSQLVWLVTFLHRCRGRWCGRGGVKVRRSPCGPMWNLQLQLGCVATARLGYTSSDGSDWSVWIEQRDGSPNHFTLFWLPHQRCGINPASPVAGHVLLCLLGHLAERKEHRQLRFIHLWKLHWAPTWWKYCSRLCC